MHIWTTLNIKQNVLKTKQNPQKTLRLSLGLSQPISRSEVNSKRKMVLNFGKIIFSKKKEQT